MKSSKKQGNLSKKDSNGNNIAPKIETFFKSAPKSFVIDESSKKLATPEDSTKQFYIDALKKKLQVKQNNSEKCEDDIHKESGACAETNDVSLTIIPKDNYAIQSSSACAECLQLKIELSEWKAKCMEWEDKYKVTKKNYAKLAIHDSELGVKYNDLLKMATSIDRPDADEAAASSEDIFTPNEIKYFRSMPIDKKKDSTFVLQCLEYAYKTDPSVLCRKTLKGRLEWIEITEGGIEVKHPAKTPVTPIKAERIKALFTERVSKIQDLTDYGERMAPPYLNKLFASGIKNISKRFEPKPSSK